jgi:uncharacterized protein
MEMAMKIVMTGASGLIGSALMTHLNARGLQVIPLVRHPPRQDRREIYWDPAAGRIDAESLEGFDAVIHLAGESIASGRWTPAKKRSILASRVEGTKLLVRTLRSLRRPPQIMISPSAIGYYGDCGAKILREDDSSGTGFLAGVCREWESAAGEMATAGTRLILLRLGMVLSKSGGGLQRMLPVFRVGLGGKIGDGCQYVAWIAIDDLLGIVDFALLHASIRGAVNAVAPNPVTSHEFSKILGRVLRRPALFPVPPFAVRLMFGEMGEQVLLASARVVPARLIEAGYQFRYADLEGALRHVLGSG